MRLGRTEDSPPRSTVAPGAGGPVPPHAGREGTVSTMSTAPGSGEVRALGAVKHAAEAHEPPSPRAFPSRTRAGRGALQRRKCARRGPAGRVQRSHEGILTHRAASLSRRVESQSRLRGPHPFTSQWFHALLNSLFKVLFNFPLGYLSTIGLVPVFSLRWSLPLTLGCIPKQPDSEKTGPRRDEGRYRPHTVHGMSIDQKDSSPRATPGKRSSIRHMSPIRPADRDSALGCFLFARCD